LFSGFDSNKKRDKSRKDPSIGVTAGDERPTPNAGAFSQGQNPRDMGGVTIQEYSKAKKVPEPEAWRQLRRGELVGRTFEGRLYVFTNAQDALPENIQNQLSPAISELLAEAPEESRSNQAILLHEEKVVLQELGIEKQLFVPSEQSETTIAHKNSMLPLPPLPIDEPQVPGGQERTVFGASNSSPMLPATTERITNTELALLLDHLSLAKEENREILKMTQESIRKVTELTDTIVEMKDTVIEAKETQIMFLKDQLETREKEIRKLMQQKEDLEILAQTIMATQQPEKRR
jgi:hypothetical protein